MSELLRNEGPSDLPIEVVQGHQPMPLDVFRDLVKKLTGSNTRISRNFSAPIKIEFSDIAQLDLQMRQLFAQYHVASQTCTVNVLSIDNTEEEYEDFERFSKVEHNTKRQKTIGVQIKYHLVIRPPQSRNLETYEVICRLTNIISHNVMMAEGPVQAMRFIRYLSGGPATIQVNYVDYVVARTISDVFASWIEACPKGVGSDLITWLQPRSHYIRHTAAYLLLLVVAISLFATSRNAAWTWSSQLLYELVLLSGLALFLLHRVGDFLGGKIENMIDNWSALSYVKLTAGDAQAIEAAQRKTRWGYVYSGISALAWLVLGVAVKVGLEPGIKAFLNGFSQP